MLTTTMIGMLKRHKRLLIALASITLAAIGLVLGLYAILVIWAAQATPIAETSDRIDFIGQLEAHADSLVPDPDRARENWSHLVEANRLVWTAIDEAIQDRPDENLSWYDADLTEPESEDEDANEVVTDFGREVFARLASTEFDQHLDALVAAEHALRPVRGLIPPDPRAETFILERLPDDPAFSLTYNEYTCVRRTAFLCKAKMADAIARHDPDEFLIHLARLLAVACHVTDQPLIFDSVVGGSCRYIAITSHTQALAASLYDERSLAHVLAILDRNRPPPDIDRHLASWRIYWEARYQGFYAHNGLLIPRLFARSAKYTYSIIEMTWRRPSHRAALSNRRQLRAIATLKSLAAPIALLAPRYETTIEDMDAAADELAAYVDLTAAEATRIEHDNTRPDLNENYVIAAGNNLDSFLNGRLLHSHWATNHTHYDAVRLLTAIHLFIARHGAPPATLDELTPGILPQLPRARIYDADGQFSYRVNDDPDRPFDLWLDGLDLVDNDATPSDRGPGGQLPGEDWVFTDPDAW